MYNDEKDARPAGVQERGTAPSLKNVIPKIERVLSDKAFAYRESGNFKFATERIGAESRFTKAHGLDYHRRGRKNPPHSRR